MKRILLVFILALLPIAAKADNVSDLMGLGMPGGLAKEVDDQYSAAETQSSLPATTNVYDLGSASKIWRKAYVGNVALPVGTVSAAATPANTAPVLAEVPTVAANAGVYLISTPVAGTLQIVRNSGGNTIKVYPDAAASINGGTAGASVDLATVKTLICFAKATTAWLCTWGQGS